MMRKKENNKLEENKTCFSEEQKLAALDSVTGIISEKDFPADYKAERIEKHI